MVFPLQWSAGFVECLFSCCSSAHVPCDAFNVELRRVGPALGLRQIERAIGNMSVHDAPGQSAGEFWIASLVSLEDFGDNQR